MTIRKKITEKAILNQHKKMGTTVISESPTKTKTNLHYHLFTHLNHIKSHRSYKCNITWQEKQR